MEVLERFLLAPGNGGELGTVRTQTHKDKIMSFQSRSMNPHALYTCACKIQEIMSTVFICSKVEGCSVVYSWSRTGCWGDFYDVGKILPELGEEVDVVCGCLRDGDVDRAVDGRVGHSCLLQAQLVEDSAVGLQRGVPADHYSRRAIDGSCEVVDWTTWHCSRGRVQKTCNWYMWWKANSYTLEWETNHCSLNKRCFNVLPRNGMRICSPI